MEDQKIDVAQPDEAVQEQQVVGAALALFDPIAQAASELTQRYGNVVYDLTTTKGNTEARQARKELVTLRGRIKACYTGWNQPVLAAQKAMRTKVAELEAAVKAVEDPLDAQIAADEQRRDAERQERVRQEQERMAAITTKIGRIQHYALDAAGESSAAIQSLHDELEATSVTTEEFNERTGEATQAKQKALETLQTLLVRAQAHEAKEAELKEQAAALAKQQEEARKQAEAAAEAERAARVAREAVEAQERARIAAEQQAERDRLAAEAKRLQDEADAAQAARDKADAEAKAKRDEEDRIAKEARAAEDARLAAERKKFEDEQKAIRDAAEAKAAEERRIAKEKADAEQKRLDDEAAEKRRQQDAAAAAEREAHSARLRAQQMAQERLQNGAQALYDAAKATLAAHSYGPEGGPDWYHMTVDAVAAVDGDA